MSALRILLLAAAMTSGLLAAPAVYDAPRNFSAPSRVIAAADFDSDGALDLVSATKNIVLSIGRGDGTLKVAVPIETGTTYVTALVAGDFNADAHPDLASVRYTASGLVSVRLGNGDGTFAPAATYAVGPSPVALVTADFTGDEVLDLAAASLETGTVSLLTGVGNGTFEPAVPVAAGPLPIGLMAGDFDGDGSGDLAAWDGISASVSILLSDGAGGFSPAKAVHPPAGARLGAVGPGADYDNDGDLDLAIMACVDCSSRADIELHLYRGVGDGTFPTHDLVLHVGENERPASAGGDFDGDGQPDIAVSKGDELIVMLGEGGGSFTVAPASRSFGTSNGPIAVGHFDGDSHVDVAAGLTDLGMIGIRVGLGDGTFHEARDIAPGLVLGEAVSADFDRDGHLDVAAAGLTLSTGEAALTVLRGTGAGTFEAPLVFPGPGQSFYMRFVAADLDGDDIPDLVGTDGFHDVAIYRGLGDATFAALPAVAAGERPSSCAIADFDADGIPDLAIADAGNESLGRRGTIWLLYGEGAGTFAAPVSLGGVSNSMAIVAADFNGDLAPDLAAASQTSPSGNGAVTIFLNNSDGSFAPSYIPTTSWRAAFLAAGDINGDAHDDLVVTLNTGSSPSPLISLLGQGNGTFTFGGYVIVPDQFASAPLLHDLNGDLALDLVVGQWLVAGGAGVAYVFTGDNSGTFAPADLYQVSNFGSIGAALAADFDGNGTIELVVGDSLLSISAP